MLVLEKDGEELLILTSVQEMIVRVSGERPHNLVLASVEWPVMVITHILLPVPLLMEQATRGCVGELEDTRRETLELSMDHALNLILKEQLMQAMLLDYQSLTVVILVSTFGLLLVVVVKEITLSSTALALSPIMHYLLFLLLAMTITVNQLLGIITPLEDIFSMTLYGMVQDV